MPFKKGNKLSKGKPKGAIHEKTKQWEAIAENMTTTHAARFNSILETADDKTFAELYIKVLEFFKPKFNRTEMTGKDGKDLKTIININANNQH